MKNVFLLETEKPSKLAYYLDKLKLGIHDWDFEIDEVQPVNIYITSNEEIKIGDWYKTNKFIWQMKYPQWGEEGQGDAKKIILTTDEDLIQDGIQKINDEFLQWFVNNSSCEEVKVDSWKTRSLNNIVFDVPKQHYEIIIPKDKVMQRFIDNAKQERLEKYSERFDNNNSEIGDINTWGKRIVKITLEEVAKNYSEYNEQSNKAIQEAVKFGAEWQAENMYNEQEVLKILNSFSIDSKFPAEKDDILVWFKQFKK